MFNAAALCGSLFLAVFGLKETMPGSENKKDYGIIAGKAMKRALRRAIGRTSEGYTAVDEEESQRYTDVDADLMDMRTPKTPSFPAVLEVKTLPAARPKLSITSRAIYTREVLVTIASFALLPLHNSAFMQIFPVFLSTPPS